jgi:hypothetical protein
VLTHEKLSQRIRSRPGLAFSVWDGKVRLSIAGYQDKIAILKENDLWFLLDGGDLASTHLLKPDPIRSGLQDIVIVIFKLLFIQRIFHALVLFHLSACGGVIIGLNNGCVFQWR